VRDIGRSIRRRWAGGPTQRRRSGALTTARRLDVLAQIRHGITARIRDTLMTPDGGRVTIEVHWQRHRRRRSTRSTWRATASLAGEHSSRSTASQRRDIEPEGSRGWVRPAARSGAGQVAARPPRPASHPHLYGRRLAAAALSCRSTGKAGIERRWGTAGAVPPTSPSRPRSWGTRRCEGVDGHQSVTGVRYPRR
jgi:hypothetical protein